MIWIIYFNIISFYFTARDRDDAVMQTSKSIGNKKID